MHKAVAEEKETVAEIVSKREVFKKPIWAYRILLTYGPNLIVVSNL